MGTISIKIDDKKKKKLKAIASIQGKTMSGIVENLVDDYVSQYYQQDDRVEELKAIMKVSEPSFDEWDNDEDEIYNEL